MISDVCLPSKYPTINSLHNPDANVSVTGLAGTTALGTISVVPQVQASVTGVSARGAVGGVLVWNEINPSVGTTWTNITASQTPDWVDIAA